MNCPSCQTDNPPDAKFCKECATPFLTSKPSPPHEPIPSQVTRTLKVTREQVEPEELATVSLFASRYQIIQELGHGGMGRVYRNLIRQATKQGYAYDYLHPCEDFESLADYPPYIQLMKPKG